MSKLAPILHDSYISHDAALVHEYIGSVFMMLSTDKYAFKLFVPRHSYSTMSSLHDYVPEMNYSLFHIYKQRVMNRDSRMMLIHLPFTHVKERSFHQAIFIEYGFFSQVEWRYVRNSFANMHFTTTVVHYRMHEITMRHAPFLEQSASLRCGHLLLLSPDGRNISVSVFLQMAYILYLFISRSRTEDTRYENDFFSSIEFCGDEHDIPVDDDDADDDDADADDDEEMNEHESEFSVEEQFMISGFAADGALFSMPALSVLLPFTYASYFEAVYAFQRDACIYLLPTILSYVRFASEHIGYVCVYILNVTNVSWHTFYYSDYQSDEHV